MNSIAPCYLSRRAHRHLLRPSYCAGISSPRASDAAASPKCPERRHPISSCPPHDDCHASPSATSRPLQHHSLSTNRRYHASRRLPSDSLLGHSPMARSVPTTSQQARGGVPSNNNKGSVWGTDSNTAGGGVWAQQSSKREKLSELLTDLNAEGVDTATKGMETLDEAASSEEKLDLELADGLKIMASYVDDGNAAILDLGGTSTSQASATEGTEQLFQLLKSSCTVDEWDRQNYETTMKEAICLLSADLPSSDAKRPAGSLDTSNSLCYIREFVEEGTDAIKDDEPSKSTIADRRTMEQLNDVVSDAFTSSAVLYRTLLLREAAQTLLDNWDTLTTVTSGDIDRAAIEQIGMPPQRSTVKSNAIQKLFEAYGAGSSQDWVQAWWGLIDNDGDGLIDETEMNSCIELALAPVHRALEEVVALSLEVCPARTIGLGKGAKTPWFMGGDDMSSLDSSASNNPSAASNLSSNKLSWRSRRAELKTRALLLKTFRATLARHFRDQVETPHRLRCLYAWAEKGHQNNKIDSIHVDASEDWGAASSIVGKKRYVELEPKISYMEFRKEQGRHFPHLDKMGEEIAMSFKEDLWVLQGKQRQNKELKRQCFYFLLGVSIVDLGIGMV